MVGLIPQSFIDDLLSRIDIIDVIDQRVPLKKSGANYKACCPFHGEKTPSFTVNQAKQFYHCFGCGVNGTAISFLMEYERLEFPEAIEELAKSIGLEVPREETPVQREQRKQSVSLYDLLSTASKHYQHELKRAPNAIQYLKDRGLSGETAQMYQIGFAPDGWDFISGRLGKTTEDKQKLDTAGMLIKKESGGYYDRFRDRVMFPIRDPRGKTIGFGGRVMGSGEPKYLNSPETPIFQKGKELYGLYEAKKNTKKLEKMLVVEGYMDVVMLAEHNIHNTVATLGTACTEDHIQRLFRVVDKVIFCFDGDRAGKAAAWRALNNSLSSLQDDKSVSFLFLPDGEDPDSLVQKEGKDNFLERASNATPLSDYLINHLMEDNPLRSSEDIARLVSAAKPLIEQISAETLKTLIKNAIAQKAGTSSEHLFKHADSLDKPSFDKNPVPQTPETQRKKKHPDYQVIRGNKRNLIAALLQQPSLAQTVSDMELDIIEPYADAGVKFIIEMIDLIKEEPKINSASLIERYRGFNLETQLKELLSFEFITHEDSDTDEDSMKSNNAITDVFQDGFKKIYIAARGIMYKEICSKPRALQTDTDRQFLKNFHASQEDN